jgi:outer membrane receptor protein involved in Fe transport
MKPLSRNSALIKLSLLTATMLSAPGLALAQTPPPPPPAEEAGSDVEPSEILVLGKNIPEPQRDTSEVVTVLTAEDLARSGDDNAAAALTRLSGLSVVSGKFVYVRGLGDRYSQALLNGSPLPSPEPLRRQVPLDLFPSNILEGAVVQKTFSPDYPGEFGGGVIDLQTLRKPEEPFLNFELGVGMNTVSTAKNGLVYEGSKSDWIGFGGAVRNVPDALQAAFDSGRYVNGTNFTATELQTIGRSLANTPLTLLQEQLQWPDFKGELTAGKTFEFGTFDLGLLGVVGYDSSQRIELAKRDEVVGGVLQKSSDVNTTNWDVVFNAFASASLSREGHSLTLSGLLVRSSEKKAQNSETFDVNLPAGQELYSEATAWYERQLLNFQISGEHQFNDAFLLEWRTSVAETTRDAPYERSIDYSVTPTTRRATTNSYRFGDLNDQLFSAGIDAHYTLPLSDFRDAVFSVGYAFSRSDREYDQRRLAFRPTTSDPGLLPPSLLANRPDFVFQPDAIRPDGFQLEEISGNDDSYDAGLIIHGGYVAADVEIIPLVHIAAGVRYETAVEKVRTFNNFNRPTLFPSARIENDYFLPAATATWNFAENMQLRAGFSKTIARPQFRELAFSNYIDPDTDRFYSGNPFLTDSKFNNYDLRYEYYFGTNQFVTLAGFYKDVSAPIEEVVVSREGGGTRTTFINAPGAKLLGGEAEYRTRFTMPFDVPVLKEPEWLFSVNYTYTNSNVEGDSEPVIDPTQLPARVTVPASNFALDGSDLQGTPTHIVNSQFGYETEYSQSTLLFGWVSERIARRGLGALPSVLERPGFQLDFVHKQYWDVYGQKITFGLSARNLLNENHEEFQIDDILGRSEANTFARGRTLSASVTANF